VLPAHTNRRRALDRVSLARFAPTVRVILPLPSRVLLASSARRAPATRVCVPMELLAPIRPSLQWKSALFAQPLSSALTVALPGLAPQAMSVLLVMPILHRSPQMACPQWLDTPALKVFTVPVVQWQKSRAAMARFQPPYVQLQKWRAAYALLVTDAWTVSPSRCRAQQVSIAQAMVLPSHAHYTRTTQDLQRAT
jgi:hypothetical protein